MIGTMYVDIGDTMTVRNLKTKEYALIDFTKRGWVNKEANAYKFEGKIFTSATETACKPDQHFTCAGGEPAYTFEGRWNKFADLTKIANATTERLWDKAPMPENYLWQYNMSYFAINMNHFPPELQDRVAPSDSRRRRDQRAHE